jgi:hypothetical protein
MIWHAEMTPARKVESSVVDVWLTTLKTLHSQVQAFLFQLQAFLFQLQAQHPRSHPCCHPPANARETSNLMGKTYLQNSLVFLIEKEDHKLFPASELTYR